jgi:hypothetical protein
MAGFSELLTAKAAKKFRKGREEGRELQEGGVNVKEFAVAAHFLGKRESRSGG